jgi:hypothetical protein
VSEPDSYDFETNSTPVIGAPHLYGDEPALMQRVFAAGIGNYMEFGLGGSTLAAIRAGAETIISVDSDPAWVAAVRRHAEIAPLVASGAASILHGDIGPVGAWGTPVDPTPSTKWPRYIATAWAEAARRNIFPDLVYIDGRFRVACCYAIAAIAAGRISGPPPRVLMHDISEDRRHYLDVLTFFDIAEQVGSLCLLKLREDASPVAAVASLLVMQFDFR